MLDKLWTLMVPHEKRGNKAMDEINILPHFGGVISHDYWRAYFKYMQAEHSLCNAHHLRELLRAYEQDEQLWAQKMHQFLTGLNTEVIANGGMLSSERQAEVHKQYQTLLKQAEIECPPPLTVSLEKHAKPKKGVVKRSKARKLLERLIKHPEDVLRFMTETFIPFTNNQGERDIRMTKVHQKISGCFRSMKGAEMFCRIRSYISTCQKHGITVFDALESLFMHNT